MRKDRAPTATTCSACSTQVFLKQLLRMSHEVFPGALLPRNVLEKCTWPWPCHFFRNPVSSLVRTVPSFTSWSLTFLTFKVSFGLNFQGELMGERLKPGTLMGVSVEPCCYYRLLRTRISSRHPKGHKGR